MLNVDLKQLEKVTKDFYNTTKIKIVLYDEKRKVLYSYPEQMCQFCTEIRKSNVLAEKCLHCDESGFDICEKTKKVHIYHCHMGLLEAISPICENGIIIGYMMLGQFLDSDNKKALITHAIKTAQDHHISAEVLENELNNMQVTDSKTIMSATKIMEMCACYLWHNQIISVRTDSLLRHLNNYIDEHLGENLSVNILCNYLNISKSTLYKLSNSYFKMGISDHIRLMRIKQAKLLLMDGTLNISEIAVKIGLPDPNYFTKVFKKQTEFSPNEYRKKFLTQ